MTDATKIPVHVEVELEVRSLLEGLAERGRLCDPGVELEANAAERILRKLPMVAILPKSPGRCVFEARLRALDEAICPIGADEELPDGD